MDETTIEEGRSESGAMSRVTLGGMLLFGSPVLAAGVTASILAFMFYALAVAGPVRPHGAWLWLWVVNGVLAGARSATGAVLRTSAPQRLGVSAIRGFLVGAGIYVGIAAIVVIPLALYGVWVMMHIY